MTPNKHAAPVGETGSGADPQTQGNTELNNTNPTPREAASDGGLLHMLIDLPADGGRYMKTYRVTISLNVEPVAPGGKAGEI